MGVPDAYCHQNGHVMQRRRLLLAVLAVPSALQAQGAWPDRPVRIGMVALEQILFGWVHPNR